MISHDRHNYFWCVPYLSTTIVSTPFDLNELGQQNMREFFLLYNFACEYTTTIRLLFENEVISGDEGVATTLGLGIVSPVPMYK